MLGSFWTEWSRALLEHGPGRVTINRQQNETSNVPILDARRLEDRILYSAVPIVGALPDGGQQPHTLPLDGAALTDVYSDLMDDVQGVPEWNIASGILSGLEQVISFADDHPVPDSIPDGEAVGAATVASAALSAGYALWAVRGSRLLGSLLSSLPTWAMIDPLPVLDAGDEQRLGKRSGAESLAEITAHSTPDSSNRKESVEI